MTDNIKIYVSCHKECYMPKGRFFYPIQVGAKNAQVRFPDILHDDVGDHISEKNPMYCELTAQYWAWKNDQADYYGFFHYRRYFSFSDHIYPENRFVDALMDYLDDSVYEKLALDEHTMRQKICQYDMITTKPVCLKKLHRSLKSNYHQYVSTPYQYQEDLDLLLDIIREKYPAYYDTAKYYLHQSPIGYYCNMFIMKKEIFTDYCEWLFTILSEHERRRNYTNYDADAYRVSGYLGERLFGIYYMHLKNSGQYKCCELQRVLFANVEKREELKPAFTDNNTAIALAANDGFVPYLATTLQSVIENASSNNNYDIIILSQDISVENKRYLRQMIKLKKNFCIRFLNPAPLIQGRRLFTRGHFSIETYYRLALPEMLQHYKKIVYLDSDLVVESDIAALYQENIEGYLLAAARDADTAGLYNGFEPDKKEYTDHVLQLARPFDYFQAGVILFNLEEFRRQFTTDEIFQFAEKENWQLLDQDILNKLCEGKVKYVDMAWNVMVDFNNIRISQIIKLAPQWLNKMYMEARKKPKIIHYAGPQKPWIFPEMDMGLLFWKYAKHTPYYETMLFRMQAEGARREVKRYRMGIVKLVRRGMQCVRENGVWYTVKYVPKRLFG